MIGLLLLFGLMGYCAGAGASHYIRAAEFCETDHAPAKVAAALIVWPLALPLMLGILVAQRWRANAKLCMSKRDALAAAGGIMLAESIAIRDDETYRRLSVAVQKYEREHGYGE